MEPLVTSKQLSKLHVLLAQSGLTEHKRDMVYQVSEKRTYSSKELTYNEVCSLIEYLENFIGTDKLRKKVYALAYQAEIIYGHTVEDRKMNAAKLNKFLLDRGAVKKQLNNMSKAELLKVVNQFAAIVKHNSEGKEKKNAQAEVDSLLNELNIGLVG